MTKFKARSAAALIFLCKGATSSVNELCRASWPVLGSSIASYCLCKYSLLEVEEIQGGKVSIFSVQTLEYGVTFVYAKQNP